MPFLHILLDLKELYQELLGVGIGFVQPPLDPTGAQHPSAWVGPGEAQDAINFLATASFDEFAVHFKDKGGVGRNVRRRAILAQAHSLIVIPARLSCFTFGPVPSFSSST